MTEEEYSAGVIDLAKSLRTLQEEYDLHGASATKQMPDGHEITLRWCEDSLELERDDGWLLPLDGTTIRREREEEA